MSALLVLLAGLGQLLLTLGEVGRALVQLLLGLEGVDRTGDVRQRAPRRHGRVDGLALGGREAVLAVQHHVARAARDLRDLLAEVIEHLRELAVGQLELVGQRPLERHHRSGDAAEDQHPGDEHGDGSSGGAQPEAVEEGSHISCPCWK